LFLLLTAAPILYTPITLSGNEFSLHMLLASDFVLNGPLGSGMAISPWLMETRNIVASLDPLRKVTIPDVDPYSLVGDSETSADFSMAAGDFNSIYSADSEANAWDAVAASFFIDACDNAIKSLQVIYHMLKPGGCLISFGPLHWHWSGPSMGLADESVDAYRQRWKHLDQRYVESVDLSWEDVQVILKNIGFEMLHVNRNQKAYYTADARSMLLTEYRCVHFVARKPQVAVPPPLLLKK
jgi:carnosine N-methyltransferase